MSDYLTTRELAALLRIKERKVYELAGSGAVPCSRVTGKLLFPRAEVEAWIAAGATRGRAAARDVTSRRAAEPRLGMGRVVRPAVVLGSHDPLLDWALRESRCGLATFFDGSSDGLIRFQNGEGLAAGLHLPNSEDGTWNTEAVREICSGADAVLVEWVRRSRGLIVAAGNGAKIKSVGDLAGRRVAARQPEAGSQAVLEKLLRAAGLGVTDVTWTKPARNETDAALMVAEGKADAAPGLEGVAAQYRLKFIPIIRERFDLLVDRHAWFEPAWQKFIAFCATKAFEVRAREIGGYEIGEMFAVQLNLPRG